MTTFNGIHDAQYLAQFLGKKIAVRDAHNPNKYDPNKYAIYPKLYAIYSDGLAHVMDKDGHILIYSWDYLESLYVILQLEIEIK